MKPAINLLAAAIIISISISPVAVAQTGQQQQAKPAQPADRPAQLLQEPPQVAPNYQAPLRPLPSAERVGVESQAGLSLEEAIRLALANNNDIDTSRIDTQIAAFEVKAARGIYDPRLTTDLSYERANSPVASLFGGGPEG